MTEISHNPDQSRNIYPAPQYPNFDPYAKEADRWLYEESRGDSHLLFMLLVKEDYHRRLSSHHAPLPDRVNIEAVNKHIVNRNALLDAQDKLDEQSKGAVPGNQH